MISLHLPTTEISIVVVLISLIVFGTPNNVVKFAKLEELKF
jgi:hypothetical protein